MSFTSYRSKTLPRAILTYLKSVSGHQIFASSNDVIRAPRFTYHEAIICLYIGLTAAQFISGTQNLYSSKQAVMGQAHALINQNFTISIEKRSLAGNHLNGSASNQPEAPAVWLMMEGDDLQTTEAKSLPSYSDSSSDTTIRNGTTKRTGQKRKGSSKGSSKSVSSNKTHFDDEESDSSESNEIFDDAEDGSGLAGSLKEPECGSHGRYYCTYKEDYPLKLVTEVTKYYKWPLEKLFRDLHAQIMPKLAQDSTGNLVCDSITRVVRPGWARNTNDRWLVVINTENYHQYVTEVVCQYGTNSRCNFIPPCYYSSCQQRYNTQKLLVIDPLNPYRGPFLSEFLFPSCCVCYVPTASESFQDKYRSSPATIYQRTMQQEASNNQYPPQFRPANLVEEVSSLGGSRASSTTQKQVLQPLGPGEIRREGEQYKKAGKELSSSNKKVDQELNDFPRLGMADISPGKTDSRVVQTMNIF